MLYQYMSTALSASYSLTRTRRVCQRTTSHPSKHQAFAFILGHTHTFQHHVTWPLHINTIPQTERRHIFIHTFCECTIKHTHAHIYVTACRVRPNVTHIHIYMYTCTYNAYAHAQIKQCAQQQRPFGGAHCKSEQNVCARQLSRNVRDT